MILAAPQQLRRPAHAAWRLRRQRRFAGPPHAHAALRTDHVLQPHLGQPLAKPCVRSVAGIGQHHTARQPRIQGLGNLIHCNLRLGLEFNFLRHAGTPSPHPVLGPFSRQVQPPGHRQAGLPRGERQCHRHLAIVLLAQLRRNTAAPRQPSVCPSSGCRCRRRSRPRRAACGSWQAAPAARRRPARPRRSTAPCSPGAGAIAAPPGRGPGGAGRRSVQSTCVAPAAAGRGSNLSGVVPGPGAPRRKARALQISREALFLRAWPRRSGSHETIIAQNVSFVTQ
jgi:hypothetical protein